MNGNNFVFLDECAGPILTESEKSRFAYLAVDGYFGIGSDNLILIQPNTARDVLVDEMAKRLKEHEIAEKVTTNEEIARLRQASQDVMRLTTASVRSSDAPCGSCTMPTR